MKPREVICSKCQALGDTCGAHRMRNTKYDEQHSYWLESPTFREWYFKMLENNVPPLITNLYPYNGRPAILNLEDTDGSNLQVVLLRPATPQEIACYRLKYPPKARIWPGLTTWLTHVD